MQLGAVYLKELMGSNFHQLVIKGQAHNKAPEKKAKNNTDFQDYLLLFKNSKNMLNKCLKIH